MIMRFVADSMLGRLTRWLRLSGYDVEYSSMGLGDAEILDLASKDKRVLLTRDLNLYQGAEKRGVSAVLVESGDIVEQLKQLIDNQGVSLSSTPLFSRCPVCNGEIIAAKKETLEGVLPGSLLRKVKEFWQCSVCEKVYWEGRHWEKIKKTIEKVRDDV